MSLTLLTFLTGLTLLTASGWGDDHLLGGAVLGADHVVTSALVNDGGPAGGSAVGGVHALAGAVDDGGSARLGDGETRRRGDGSRGRGDVAGADLRQASGEAFLVLPLHVGGFPQEKGEVGMGESPVLLVLPLEMQLFGALGKVALGIERGGVSLRDEGAAGRALLVEGGRLGWEREKSRKEKAESRNGEPGFHVGILARVAVFGKVGKRRGTVKGHHRMNDQGMP